MKGERKELAITRMRNWVSEQGTTHSRKLKIHYTNKL